MGHWCGRCSRFLIEQPGWCGLCTRPGFRDDPALTEEENWHRLTKDIDERNALQKTMCETHERLLLEANTLDAKPAIPLS